MAQMQKEFVEKDKLLSGEELVNLSCLGRSLPGTMIGNVAFMFGHRVGGWLCGISCLLGMISAPFIVLAVITFFYTSLLNQPVFLSAMSGVRAAVIPIIMSAALTMKKDAFPRRYCYLIALGGFVLYYFFNVSCVALVLGAAIANLGILSPTLTVCAVFAVFYKKLGNSNGMQQALCGIRPACLGMVCAVIVSMALEC